MGVTNRGRYSNPEFDKVLADALVTMDDKKREALIQQAAEMAMNDTGAHPDPLRGEHLGHRQGLRYTPRTDQYTLATGSSPRNRPRQPEPRPARPRASSRPAVPPHPMLAYAIRRLGQSVFVLVLMSFLVFVGVYAIGNPVELLVNPQADEVERAAPPRRSASTSRSSSSTGSSSVGAASGDLGRSFVYNVPGHPR